MGSSWGRESPTPNSSNLPYRYAMRFMVIVTITGLTLPIGTELATDAAQSWLMVIQHEQKRLMVEVKERGTPPR
ncbi:hypothetical protein KRMM14A1004_49280 [Krasilnikovia sp. MM14-A1004]